MKHLACLGLLLVSADAQATDAILSFSGIDGTSTYSEVLKRFPKAEKRSHCREAGQILQRSSEGPYRCDVLYVDQYELGGYKFHITFAFHESGGLKHAFLAWPTSSAAKNLTTSAIDAAYTSTLSMLVSKYGRYVKQPPCQLAGRRCAEWQIDGEIDWHAGGERIKLAADTDLGMFNGITLTYTFADRRSFDRF